MDEYDDEYEYVKRHGHYPIGDSEWEPLCEGYTDPMYEPSNAYGDIEPDAREYATDDHYCKHGNYIGSWAGPDYMCGLCEMGQDYPYSYNLYRVQVTFVARAGYNTGKVVTHNFEWRRTREKAVQDIDIWLDVLDTVDDTWKWEIQEQECVGWSDDPKDQTLCPRCGTHISPKLDVEDDTWRRRYCFDCRVELLAKYRTEDEDDDDEV